MIVKQIGCDNVKAGILYAGNKKDAQMIISNYCYGSPRDIANQFLEVQEYNKTSAQKNKSYHTVIGFSKEDIEKITNKDKEQIVKSFAKKMGFENNQYVAYEHQDGNSPHFHFIGNRICNEGKSVSLSNNYYKHESFCRNQEKQYNLAVVKTKERTKSAQQTQSLSNHRKIELKNLIDDAISISKSLEQFTSQMNKKNIKVLIGRGISFTDRDNVNFKGSSIGRNYSLSNIKKALTNQIRQENKLEY